MTDAAKTTETGTGLKLAIDFGPLLAFFIANSLAGVFTATAAFMAATAVAMLVSKMKMGRVSPMLWLSGVMVLGFGGLTLWLHNETFIKVKPTIVYVMFASILFFGLISGKPTLKIVLETAYPGLDEAGWHKLTRNWGLFFIAMALLNEAVWRTQSTDFWIAFKLWGVVPLSLVFAMAQAPILLKHGLKLRSEEHTSELQSLMRISYAVFCL